jgi:Chaperone of endosialidase
MNRPNPFSSATLHHVASLISRSPLWRGYPVVLLVLLLALFAFSPTARAQLPAPTPDGGYPHANTAEGDSALFNLTTGTDNTAIGFQALSSVEDGGENTAVGSQALAKNLSFNNTAVGFAALQSNTGDPIVKGSSNTAIGASALIFNKTGSDNVAIGMAAGSNLTTGSNNIDIGFNVDGLAGESNTIRIGKSGTQTKTVIAGIRGTTIANGQPVVINSNGQLGTVTSSERFKDQIKSMDKVSESILNLKPVTFRYKEEFDPEGIPQFGLIAEQVEKVNPDLVVRDDQGKVNTVRYDAVNAMLLNEFLKEHQTVQDLKSTVAKQEAAMAQRQKQIEALTATVQKVSEQVALSKRSPQLVANP